MNKAVPNPPLVVNRWPKNLNDVLVRAMMKPPQQLHEGNSPCGRPRCKKLHAHTCWHDFESASMGEKFRVHVTTNCRTKNIIYLIECRKCKKKYIGETENPLHLRMDGHRSDHYCKLSNKPVAEHFKGEGTPFGKKNPFSVFIFK